MVLRREEQRIDIGIVADPVEAAAWSSREPLHPRFHTALRLDSLLHSWPESWRILEAQRFAVSGNLSPRTVAESRAAARALGRLASEAALQPLIDALRAHGCTIRAVRPVRSSLEDLFMKAVTDPTTGQVLAPGASKEPARKKGLFGGKGGAP